MHDQAAQLAEVYWMSLTRDVPFNNYGANETTIAAAGTTMDVSRVFIYQRVATVEVANILAKRVVTTGRPTENPYCMLLLSSKGSLLTDARAPVRVFLPCHEDPPRQQLYTPPTTDVATK